MGALNFEYSKNNATVAKIIVNQCVNTLRAYGVKCDVDFENSAPIKPTTRRRKKHASATRDDK